MSIYSSKNSIFDAQNIRKMSYNNQAYMPLNDSKFGK